MAESSENITRLLQAAGGGDIQAGEELLRAVYAELRRMAQKWMGQTPPGQTLQPTALVHEAFLRMVGPDKDGWDNRAHFFYAASRAMRDILIDRARGRAALKRGSGCLRIELEKLVVAAHAPDEDLLALDESLQLFETQYPW